MIETFTLKDKTALVCGASAGIGRATAELFAASGARVTCLARSADKLKAVVQALPGEGHHWLAVDLSELEALEQGIRGKSFDIVVNNSGGPKGGPILQAQADEFTATFRAHVLSAQLLAQLIVPSMKEKKFGRFINVISTSVKAPILGLGVSNTIRAAMASWAKTLSLEVASFGITVNSVLPGYTETDRLTGLIKAGAVKMAKSENEVIEDWINQIPARRFAKPGEIAVVIAFLASPAAGYVNGVTIPVDGGRTPTI